MTCMGGELRLKARAREGRAMARPSEMMQKNKRKELEEEEEEEDRAGASEKRSKLNVEGEERERGEHGHVGHEEESRAVGRILEARRRKSSRPLPALMGDKAVDLIALHSKVSSMGGYSKVTEGRLWGSISDALGLGQERGPGLKLVYVKYLKVLESERHGNDGRTSARLDTRHENGELWVRSNDSGSDDPSDEEIMGDLRSRHSQLECRQSSTSTNWVEHPSRNPSDRGTRSDEDSGASEDWYEGGREENVNLQREALTGMMEWIKRVALSPGDSSIGMSTPGSDQNDDWVCQCQMLTAKVRSVLWKERADSSMQARPAAYYDELMRPDAQALERLRVTRERLAQFGFEPPPGPRSGHHRERSVEGSYWGAAGGQRSGRQAVNYTEAAFGRYNPQRKRIPIGPEFQADEVRWVPRDQVHEESEDEEDDDDSRWLGVRVWPQPGGAVDSSQVRVGRGRASSCECAEPGSMNCVRVHIDAARARLKMELGQAWVEMGFDQMGECVAEHWTKDEERTFRLVARTHPVSKSSNFWDYLPEAFPYKSRTELNSYYFNVFMLRRRALQNRLGLGKIDSDDDEGELPGESDDDSGYDDSEEEEDEDDEEEDEDGGMAVYPVKTPIDSTRVPKYRALPDFNYSPSEDAGARIGQVVDENHGHGDDPHVVLVWGDEKQLEPGSLVRDGALWQEPHWQEGVTSSRPLSPRIGKEGDVRQAPALGDLWSQSMEMAPKREKDRLLSTNGMILELFGDDVSD